MSLYSLDQRVYKWHMEYCQFNEICHTFSMSCKYTTALLLVTSMFALMPNVDFPFSHVQLCNDVAIILDKDFFTYISCPKHGGVVPIKLFVVSINKNVLYVIDDFKINNLYAFSFKIIIHYNFINASNVS